MHHFAAALGLPRGFSVVVTARGDTSTVWLVSELKCILKDWSIDLSGWTYLIYINGKM